MRRAGKALIVVATLLLSSGDAGGARDIPLEVRIASEEAVKRAVLTDAGRRLTLERDGVKVDFIEEYLAQRRVITVELPATPAYPAMHFTYEGRAVCTPQAPSDCLYRFDDGVQEPHTRSKSQFTTPGAFMPVNQAEYAALKAYLSPLVDGEGTNDLAWRAEGESLVRLVQALKEDARANGVLETVQTGNPPGSTGYLRRYAYGTSNAVLRHNTGNGKNEYVLDLTLNPADFPTLVKEGAPHKEHITLSSPAPLATEMHDYFLTHWHDESIGVQYSFRGNRGSVYKAKQEAARLIVDELR
ncbi:hypothetical protein D6789_02055 [Candidatus Woesearchaeota archaeon]|nr:MAG: hypothetical protein D6789_02055 [Candidatus Woesearchaeota archaeon]